MSAQETDFQEIQQQATESPLTCAECGGRHSSHSHDASLLINESYDQQNSANLTESIIDEVV